MNTEQKLIGALVVLAALGGGFYYTQKGATVERETRSTATSKSGLPIVSLDKVAVDGLTKLVIQNADKPEIVLEKKGDLWEITAPFAAKASLADVRTLLDGLKDLKVTEAIDRSTAAYEAHDVADGKGVHLVAYAGGEKKLDAIFGKSGSRGQLARIVGTDGVYVVTGYSTWLGTKDAKGWRDKAILKFEDAAAVGITIDNAHASYSFTKNEDKWTGSFTPKKKGDDEKKKSKKTDGWAELDPAKVGDMLRAYKTLNAVDFGEADADTGLDGPDAGVVKIKLKDGAGDYTLKVGKTQKGQNRFLTREGGDGTVFVVSAWAADWAVAEPKKFEKKKEGEKGADDGHGPDDGHGHGDGDEMPFDLGGLE